MPKNGMNIYQCARKSSGMTQERAAERLHLSVRALADYETGQRRPPAQTVEHMAALYDAPMLRLHHLRETDELGVIPRGDEPQRFELLSIQLYNHLMSFAQKHRGQQLLQIAADGVIDETERPLLDEIVCELEAIGGALLALKVCTKKDRFDGGTSKRPILSRAENHSNNSIPASAPICKSDFAGRCVL